MEARGAVENLGRFVAQLADAKAVGRDFLPWAKENKIEMEKLFGYAQEEGMPPICSLVKPFGHPELPLIGLNYSPLAHNTLYKFLSGWTTPLRLCRGIIFDTAGRLVAKPFPKFFNYGEHPETKTIPDLPFEATRKHDGHLGITFEYQGRLLVTTRGSFTSRTSVLAQKMLDGYARKFSWRKKFPKDTTLLVEVIDPSTHVHVDYGERRDFIIIGAYSRESLEDYGYSRLMELGDILHLPVTEIWRGSSFEELNALMADKSVSNEEGYVVRFSNGLRIKLKFKAYIGLMVKEKLNFTYLMNRAVSGNLERMISTLPEKIYLKALQMLGEIMMRVCAAKKPKDRWRELYKLVPEEQATSYFKGVCRNFVKSLQGEE